jgi:hypothetical protein
MFAALREDRRGSESKPSTITQIILILCTLLDYEIDDLFAVGLVWFLNSYSRQIHGIKGETTITHSCTKFGGTFCPIAPVVKACETGLPAWEFQGTRTKIQES